MVPTTVPTTTKKGRQTRQINIGRQAEALKSRMGKKKIAERKGAGKKRSWEKEKQKTNLSYHRDILIIIVDKN